MPHTYRSIRTKIPRDDQLTQVIRNVRFTNIPNNVVDECIICTDQITGPILCRLVATTESLSDNECVIIESFTRPCTCPNRNNICIKCQGQLIKSNAAEKDIPCSLCTGTLNNFDWNHDDNLKNLAVTHDLEIKFYHLLLELQPFGYHVNQSLTKSVRLATACVMEQIHHINQQIHFLYQVASLKNCFQRFLANHYDKPCHRLYLSHEGLIDDDTTWCMEADVLIKSDNNQLVPNNIILDFTWIEEHWREGIEELVNSPGTWISVPDKEHRIYMIEIAHRPKFYPDFRKRGSYIPGASEIYDNFAAALMYFSHGNVGLCDKLNIQNLALYIHLKGQWDTQDLKCKTFPLSLRLGNVRELVTSHFPSFPLEFLRTHAILTRSGDDFLPSFSDYGVSLVTLVRPAKEGEHFDEHYLSFAISNGYIFDCRCDQAIELTKKNLSILFQSNNPPDDVTEFSALILFGFKKIYQEPSQRNKKRPYIPSSR